MSRQFRVSELRNPSSIKEAHKNMTRRVQNMFKSFEKYLDCSKIKKSFRRTSKTANKSNVFSSDVLNGSYVTITMHKSGECMLLHAFVAHLEFSLVMCFMQKILCQESCYLESFCFLFRRWDPVQVMQDAMGR